MHTLLSSVHRPNKILLPRTSYANTALNRTQVDYSWQFDCDNSSKIIFHVLGTVGLLAPIHCCRTT